MPWSTYAASAGMERARRDDLHRHRSSDLGCSGSRKGSAPAADGRSHTTVAPEPEDQEGHLDGSNPDGRARERRAGEVRARAGDRPQSDKVELTQKAELVGRRDAGAPSEALRQPVSSTGTVHQVMDAALPAPLRGPCVKPRLSPHQATRMGPPSPGRWGGRWERGTGGEESGGGSAAVGNLLKKQGFLAVRPPGTKTPSEAYDGPSEASNGPSERSGGPPEAYDAAQKLPAASRTF